MTRYFLLLFMMLKLDVDSTAQTTFPSWLKQSNLYEINIRQFSKAGDFNGVINQIPRLKSMGVEVLVLLPVTPIGLEGRRMNETELGSLDAVRHYFEINPEFGNLKDFKKLVQIAHQEGLKVIVDWVAGYTARDHDWTAYHPAFFEKQSNGDFISLNNRLDIIKLNYAEDEMRDSMIASMKWWIKQTDIDGFRCIDADGIPIDFWAHCLAALNQTKKDMVFLAEGEGLSLHEAGFHLICGWSINQEMKKIATGATSVILWEEWLLAQRKDIPKSNLQYLFTSNQYLNAWEGTDAERYGNAASMLAVFTQTYPNSIPLIYNGQEIPLRQRLSPFTRDSIHWNSFSNTEFFQKLNLLRRNSAALSADASYKNIKLQIPDMPVWAYLREMNGERVLVLLNFNEREQRIKLRDEKAFGNATEIFSNSRSILTAETEIEIPSWGYRVYHFTTNSRNKSSK